MHLATCHIGLAASSSLSAHLTQSSCQLVLRSASHACDEPWPAVLGSALTGRCCSQVERAKRLRTGEVGILRVDWGELLLQWLHL